MEKMFEYLKTVKRGQTYFLIFCFLSLGISISITDSSSINKAIYELEAFQKYNSNYNYGNSHSLFSTVYTQTTYDKLSLFSETFRKIIDKYKNFSFDQMNFFFNPGISPDYPRMFASRDKTLPQIIENIKSLDDNLIHFYFPKKSDFEKKLDSLLERFDSNSSKYISFNKREFNYQSLNVKLFCTVFQSYDKERDRRNDRIDREIIIDAESLKIKYSLLDLLYKNNLVNEFVVRQDDGNYKIFPNLLKFWQNVKDVNPANGIERLKELRANVPLQHSITVFGFAMNLGPMKYFGQIIISLLFLYYYLHLSYIEKRKPNKENLEYFPWISIYKGRLPIFITWTITFILPSFSIIAIFFGFYTDNKLDNIYSLAISIINIFVVIWLGILINRILVKLRN